MKLLKTTFLLLTLCALGTTLTSAQTPTDSSLLKQGLQAREEIFPNGKLKAKWTERTNADGTATKHGVFENFYDNGQMKSRVEYVEGKENGMMTTWQNDGKLISTLSYKDGQLHGICTYFNTDGVKMSSGTYRDGKENGVFTLFYPSGKIQAKTTWKDGKQDGAYEVWWENGKRAKLGQSKDGMVEGHWKVWDSTGMLTLEEDYKENVLVKSVKYDSTGAVIDTTKK